MESVLRYSEDRGIVVTQDLETKQFSVPTQDEMNDLPEGEMLTAEEIDSLDS